MCNQIMEGKKNTIISNIGGLTLRCFTFSIWDQFRRWIYVNYTKGEINRWREDCDSVYESDPGDRSFRRLREKRQSRQLFEATGSQPSSRFRCLLFLQRRYTYLHHVAVAALQDRRREYIKYLKFAKTS